MTTIDWITVAGTALSLGGTTLAIFTFLRVGRVQRAQAHERRITQELLGVDQIELDLRRAIGQLALAGDRESAALVTDLSVRLGGIQGVRRALSQTERDDHKDEGTRRVVQLKEGFFGESFVADAIESAQSSIDIITGRTLLVAGFYVMDALRRACERGVNVRIVGLSPDTADEVLEDACLTVSTPAPKNAEEYRRQIQGNRETIVEQVAGWRTEASRGCFNYRVNKSVPRISMLRHDDTVAIGFLQLYRDAQPSEIRSREYLELSGNSPTGQVAMAHFELAWKRAKDEGGVILPREKHNDRRS
jgi:hypothetical protein